MKKLFILPILVLITFSISQKCFPEDFVFGTATAATQIEGAYLEDKQLSIWDAFSHTPNKTYHGQTPDVADDHYHKMNDDIALMSSLGLKSYRFSISWARIVKYEISDNGTITRSINTAGVEHYLDEIFNLMVSGIEPYITLYHWDLPEFIEKYLGGWNTDRIIDEYLFYADYCFQFFGEMASKFITFNEPTSFILEGYYYGNKAPGSQIDIETKPYEIGRRVLLAHVKAVQLFREKYASEQGKIGMTICGTYGEPRTQTPKNIDAAERFNLFSVGWFADPLYFGEYPKEMVEILQDRLPKFTNEEKNLFLKYKPDYFLMNVYTARYIENVVNVTQKGYDYDMRVAQYVTDINGKLIGPQAQSKWLYSVPWCMRKWLNWISKRYSNPIIYITENGVSVPGENDMPVQQALNDTFRVNFLKGYITEIWNAINEDKVNVKGYFLWSLMDNFEWDHGYSERFGINYVDYAKSDLPRYQKNSAKWYSKLIKSKCIEE